MPTAKVGEKTSLDRQEFLELKAKGEKARFRLASDEYYYEAKHFMKKEDGKWLVTPCPRINNEAECEYCEEYFRIRKELKEAKEANDEKATKRLDEEQRKVKPTMSFYYLVLDRETKMAAILKTRLSVRKALEKQVDDGYDILKYDFVVERTEEPGNYYPLDRVDSAETPKLTKEEEAELEKSRGMNLAEIVGGRRGSMDFSPDDGEPEGEAEEAPPPPEEEEKGEDLPF